MSGQEVFDILKYRIEVDGFGTRWYYNAAGQLHRTDGPAVEYSNGGKSWYQNGLRHRTDGPAVEYADGSKDWYQNGVRHRTDGAAVEYSNDDKEWWINGEPLTEAEYKQVVKDYE